MALPILATFNPVQYLYLNPELETYNNIHTVEDAQANYLSYGHDNNLLGNTSNLPADFDSTVYYLFNSNIILSNHSNVLPNDIIQTLSTTDVKRLSTIHYLRQGHSISNIHYNIDPHFNESLYRSIQNVTQVETIPQLYLEYATKVARKEPVIGTFDDFRVAIENYRYSSLNVYSNLTVQGDTYVSGFYASISNIDILGSLSLKGGLFVHELDTSNLILHTDNFGVTGDFTCCNAIVNGNLTVSGTLTQIDTVLQTSEEITVNNTDTAVALTVNQTGSTYDVAQFQYAGAPIMTIANTGFVGIGTTSPSSLLDVAGTTLLESDAVCNTNIASQMITLFNSNLCDTYKDSRYNMYVDADSQELRFLIPDYSNAYNFRIGNSNTSNTPTSALYIAGNGQVGINTENPLYFCHIAGDCGIDTNMYVACNIYISGTIFGNLPAVKTDGVLTINNDSYLNGNVYVKNGLFCKSLEADGVFVLNGDAILSNNLYVSSDIYAHSGLSVSHNTNMYGSLGIQISNINPLGPLHIGHSNGVKIVLADEGGAISTNIGVDANYFMEFSSSTGNNPNVVGGFRFLTSSPIGYKTQCYIDTSNISLYGTLQAMSNSTFAMPSSFQQTVAIGDSLTVTNTTNSANVIANTMTTDTLTVNIIAPVQSINVANLEASNVIVDNWIQVAGATTLNNKCTINIANPGVNDSNIALTVNGSVSAHYYYVSSDKRVKTEIEPARAELAREMIRALAPCQYNMNVGGTNKKPSWGLIGQEVEKLYPELVARSSKCIPDGRTLQWNGVQHSLPSHDLEIGHELHVRGAAGILQTVHVIDIVEDTVTLNKILAEDLTIASRTIHDFVSVDYMQLITVLMTCVRDMI